MGIPEEIEIHETKDHEPEIKSHETKGLPDFDAMTKLEIDIYARQNLSLNLDRRRTKDHMIEQINNHLSKEN